jgi:hypothetical protein
MSNIYATLVSCLYARSRVLWLGSISNNLCSILYIQKKSSMKHGKYRYILVYYMNFYDSAMMPNLENLLLHTFNVGFAFTALIHYRLFFVPRINKAFIFSTLHYDIEMCNQFFLFSFSHREPNVPVPPPEFIVKQITTPRFVLLVEETGNMNLRVSNAHTPSFPLCLPKRMKKFPFSILLLIFCYQG